MVSPVVIKRDTEQRIPMTYEEYLAALPEHLHAEWVNGEAIIFMPPTILHQRVVVFLSLILGMFVSEFKLGQLLLAPCEMRATPDGNTHEPDLFFVAAEHTARLTVNRLDGPADLVVEVISDESVMRDRVEKWREYQAAGIREYWIIDPRPGKESAEFWVLDEYGRYQAASVDPEGRYCSSVITGFWLNTNWLWGEELLQAAALYPLIVRTSRIE